MNRLKPHSFTACSRHPTAPITGFCALCLHERLAVLDPAADRNNSNAPASSSSSQSQQLQQPHLRRCKTYSCKRRDGLLATRSFEPQRKSCDVRVNKGNSLSSLFTLDDHHGRDDGIIDDNVRRRRRNVVDFNIETKNVVGVVGTVLETGEDDKIDGDDGDRDEIRVCEDVNEIGGFDEPVELKPMKEFIDLECGAKKQCSSSRDLKGIAGSIFVAASIFGKKLHKWRRKDLTAKREIIDRNDDIDGVVGGVVDIEEARNVSVGHYGFGRRSCDTEPRFSIDGGRTSLDQPRYSFDEPRASWDGYMTGRALPRPVPMISVTEDVDVVVHGNEDWLPVEERESSPGGSAQTRDYYADPSNRRRKSFDQSGLYRKSGGVDFDEMKSISNAKVSPTTVELFHGAKVLIAERDVNSNSRKDDSLERECHINNAAFVGDSSNVKGFKKYPGWNKAWSVLGSLHKRGVESKSDDVGRASPTDSSSKAASGDKAIGSSSSVSSTSSYKTGMPIQTTRSNLQTTRSNGDIQGHGNKRSEHHVLERNRSARYSPNNLDNNGLLRFYLTPLRSNRTRCGKSRLKDSHSIGRIFSRF